MLGKLPMLVEDPPYLVWQSDPKLTRYLKSLVAGQPTAELDLEQIAYVLGQRCGQLPAHPADYTEIDRQLSGCLTSLLAQIIFSPQGLGQIRAQVLKPLEYHAASLTAIDVYAIGLEIISQPVKFLQNFEQPQTSWYSSLMRYSQQRFPRLLIDRLRSSPNLSGFKRTNLGLLVRSSPTRIKTALIEAGERTPRLAGLLLVHQYLQEAVKAEQFSSKNPELTHYDQLLARSREQCERVNLPIANRDTIIELLNYMGTALRNYLQPPHVSFDRPIRENGSTIGELIPALQISPAEQIALADDQHQTRDFKQQVSSVLEQLPIDRTSLLLWLYGLQLTQAEAGLELNLNQATIKRRHDRFLAQLAPTLYQLVGSTEDLSIDTLAAVVKALIVVCENYYPESLRKILIAIGTEMDTDSPIIADALIEPLCQQFITAIEKQWQFEFKPRQMGSRKATAFVRRELKLN
jgi:DNA-directed RNA polymerase specialized sigma24 family protein